MRCGVIGGLLCGLGQLQCGIVEFCPSVQSCVKRTCAVGAQVQVERLLGGQGQLAAGQRGQHTGGQRLHSLRQVAHGPFFKRLNQGAGLICVDPLQRIYASDALAISAQCRLRCVLHHPQRVQLQP